MSPTTAYKRVSSTIASNPEARSVAERMFHAPTASSSLDDDDELVFEDEEFYTEYDSDDPRSFGGPYYWNSPKRTGLCKRSLDLTRLAAFRFARAVSFVALVAAHFFGWNRSRFQWAVDLVDKERDRREQDALDRMGLNREDVLNRE